MIGKSCGGARGGGWQRQAGGQQLAGNRRLETDDWKQLAGNSWFAVASSSRKVTGSTFGAGAAAGGDKPNGLL